MSSEYTVWFTQSASTCVTVQADSPEEAIDAAYDAGLPVSLCHQCSSEFDMSGDWEPDAVDDADWKEVWHR